MMKNNLSFSCYFDENQNTHHSQWKIAGMKKAGNFTVTKNIGIFISKQQTPIDSSKNIKVNEQKYKQVFIISCQITTNQPQ